MTRRALLRSAATTAGAVGLVVVLPGLAHADNGTGAPATGIDPAGGSASGEVGAMLGNVRRAIPDPPYELTLPAAPAPLLPVTAALPYKSFTRYGFELRTLPAQMQPYALSSPAPLGYGVVDRDGVRMLLLGGVQWNHPSAQAQYGIAMLESHRLTGDARYLQIALKQAVRLAGRARPYGGALFHPYDFPVAPHHTAVRTAPWYSAIAQGQVLDFFSRLAAVTGSASHGTTAAATFASFLVPQVAGRPWVTWVQGGHLWLDEYPRSDIALGDRTYNGHSFASFGIYQYFLRTGDERARQLVQGAFSTTRAVAPQIRNAGWRSAYCLADRADANRYHPTHTLQNLLIAAITGDASFAAVADLFDADFPDPVVTGTVLIQPGTYRAYVFDADGGVPASRLLVAPKLTSAPCSARTKIANRTGIWYLISAGTAAGYYLPERRGVMYLRGTHLPMPYLPYRTGRLSRAVPTAVRPAAAGEVALPTKTVGLAAGADVMVSQRMLINAGEYLELADPTNAGWWVPANAVLF